MSTLREAAEPDWLDEEPFYNAMQRYRCAPREDQREIVACFEAVKRLVRAELAKPDARPAPAEPQPAAQQEPVVTVWQARATHDSKSAWRQVAPTKTESTVEARVEYLKTVRRAGGEPAYEFRALYTSPPQVQRAGLTDEQIDRHSIAAADCPPSSTVILVSSLRRLLGITATKGDNHA